MWYFYLMAAFAGAAIALAVYIIVRKSILKGRSENIITKAETEAENIKKDKMLQAKEHFLQLKTTKFLGTGSPRPRMAGLPLSRKPEPVRSPNLSEIIFCLTDR